MSEEEVLVKVEGVSKKFCKNLNRSLLYGVQDLSSNIFGKDKPRNLRKSEFWAVDNVSFQLKRGDCLGLLGHNGAGKSTLLKVLSGLISPDRGRVEMRGRVTALIELGSGFNPILTGRENIFNNAAILGLSNKEIKSKLDEIIAFSEIEEFIDTPVQYYSSGMKVRLGFSVAAHLEPDVLILDEVLAVGDAGFKIKSFNKMMELMKDCAVLFVSHSMPSVARVCNKVLFMNHGKEYYLGDDTHKGIEMYFGEFKGEDAKIEKNDGAEISRILINGKVSDGRLPTVITYSNNLELNLDIEIKDEKTKSFYLSVTITDKDLKIVATYRTNKFNKNFVKMPKNSVQIIFPELLLIDGEYSITYQVISENEYSHQYEILASYRNYSKLKVIGLNDTVYSAIFLKGQVYHNGKLLTS